jgi:hypothetical protein
MRIFAWCLVAVGLLLMPASWVYAQRETARLDSVWYQQALTSMDVAEMDRSIRMLRRGERPAWTLMSPWPGVYTGGGLAGFGVLLLAIRRPAP